MLSQQVIATIKATIPVLKEHGETLTRHFYKRMFNANPEVKAFFNPAHQHSGGQQRALAAAICAYAEHIENPAALAGAVELIAQKHASLGVRAEHYPIVGENLLAAIQEVLGDAATPAIIDAWAQAYGVLAEIFIQREGQIYDAHRAEHGWSGTKTFIVRRKQRESETVTSFYLSPADGSPVKPFKAGQYVTVRVPGTWHETTLRNYSLSGKPGAPYYRISVKREPAPPKNLAARAGHVSNYLHDHVHEGAKLEVGPPCGEFFLSDERTDRPLVLISGGVGVTAVLSMLHAAIDRNETRPIHFIHAALNGETHAFREEVRALASEHPRLQLHVRYSNASDADRTGKRCDSEGLIDRALLEALVGTSDADFYFCGPKPFMACVFHALNEWGVQRERMRYEFFGPADTLQEPPVNALDSARSESATPKGCNCAEVACAAEV